MLGKDLFKQINADAAFEPRGSKGAKRRETNEETRKQKVQKHLVRLRDGKYSVSVKDKETGESKDVERKMNPGQLAESVFQLLGNLDVKPEQISEFAPDLPKRAKWAEVKSGLYAAATDNDISLTSVARVFGFEDAETTVVSSGEN